MRITTVHLILSSLFLLIVQGCAADSVAEEDDAERALNPPVLAPPGKGDVSGVTINPLAPLEFGGQANGEFKQDNQLDGYTFSAASGAHITLENTNAGTARTLDTTLFLYGPADASGFYGAKPFAQDDNSGWGPHARITNVVLPAAGQYLAVIGTFNGKGRGIYRLALTCNQESCKPPIPPSPVIVNAAKQLLTSESRQTASFTVALNEVPTENVTIWVDTTNASEGVPHPTILQFCKTGFHRGSNGCTQNTDKLPGDPEEWKLPIPVTVFGVRDEVNDGNVAYQLSFGVETKDPKIASVILPPLDCINQNIQAALDYGALQGLQNDELLTALHEMLHAHTSYGYDGINGARTVMFSTIDNRSGLIESIYTGQTIPASRDSIIAYKRGFNTEHSWPQSHFDEVEPPRSDLHHVFPADIVSNGNRSSYDFGWTAKGDGPTSLLGRSSGKTSPWVYQVRPQVRGDIARAHFYMVARYKFDKDIGIRFDDDGVEQNGCIGDTEEKVLREWNTMDPVDARERDRNNRVEAYQGKRNPFIDMPSLADQISNF